MEGYPAQRHCLCITGDPMAKAYLILDAANKVVSTHKWGGETDAPCPVEPPIGGFCIEVDPEGLETVLSLTMGGQNVEVIDAELRVDGEKVATLQNGKVVLE